MGLSGLLGWHRGSPTSDKREGSESPDSGTDIKCLAVSMVRMCICRGHPACPAEDPGQVPLELASLSCFRPSLHSSGPANEFSGKPSINLPVPSLSVHSLA